MRILIDVGHPAQFNFYKNTIIELSKKNQIYLTYLKRGKLPSIIKKEVDNLSNIHTKAIGSHGKSKIGIYWKSNILRFFTLIIFYIRNRPNIVISNGFLSGLVARIFSVSNVQFGDDPEAKDYILKKITANELYYALYHNTQVDSFNALKEWAYLSPKYFKPNLSVLNHYELEKNKYLFIREVSTGSLNYANQKSIIIASFAEKLNLEYKVILSLEDKSKINEYPRNWIMLEEPVDDIHSLMYYSKIVISSGDSMAREGAMLGVPSIYCGIREMNANRILIDKGMLYQVKDQDVPEFVNKIINEEIIVVNKTDFRKNLLEEWVDVNKFIMDKILKYKE